ncbi:hypothetical protein TKK_0015942 [Trichogramma kaykai]|uniref:Uncharacterized protein n=1 Tax=Trichogramma kaykai TaxID=54128 RepID=A0ABD2W9S4_9HYME
MTRVWFVGFIVFSWTVTGSLSAQDAIKTNATEFLQQQQFVFQILWNQDELAQVNPDLVKKSKEFRVEDLRSLPLDLELVEVFIERYNNGLLARGQSATVFNSEHLAEIKSFYGVLASAQELAAFALVSLWSSQVLNEIIWFYGFVIAVMQRPNTRNLRLPNLHELLPQYFFNNDAIIQLYKAKSETCFEGMANETIIRAEYSKVVSAYYNDPESKISYFTEDVGLSDYYFFLVNESPFWLASQQMTFPVPPRGERFFHDHQQILARYNLERLSHDLEFTEDLDWDHNVVTGFLPNMADYNGQIFPSRSSNSPVPYYKYQELRMTKNFESRLTAAADSGELVSSNSTVYRAAELPTFFSHLMDAAQSNADSVNLDFYGSLETSGRRILGFNPPPRNKFIETISAMENYNAGLRDPAFYRLYKKIVDIGHRYKSHLAPYRPEDISFPGVTITSVSSNDVDTFFDDFDSLVGRRSCSYYNRPIFFRQKRLNHDSFRLTIKVKSDYPVLSVVRIFIGPKHNARGFEIDISEARKYFFELDAFFVALPKGISMLRRSEDDFVIRAPIEEPSAVIYEKIKRALQDKNYPFEYYQQPYGWPRRLLLPRGKPGGQTFRILVSINPFKLDPLVSNPLIAGHWSIDGRPLGFPLDRPIESHDFWRPNIAQGDMTIYFRNQKKTFGCTMCWN